MFFLYILEVNLSMDDNFGIHLVSNVSTDIYPNNKPSEFSTLLADTIELNNGEWEVAVKDIMYPSHVASTTEDDKLYFYKTNRPKFRTLIPQKINASNKAIQPSRRTLSINRKEWMQFKKAKNGTKMVEVLNNTPEYKKGVYTFEYDIKSRKLALKTKVPDFVITMDPHMSQFLGFDATKLFDEGQHWASRPIDDQPNAKPPARTFMQFYDLQYLKRTDYTLQVSVNEALQSVFSTDIPYDIIGESTGQKFKFVYNPGQGTVFLYTDEVIPKSVLPRYRPILFFAFDADTTKMVPSLKKLYGMNLPHTYIYPYYNKRLRTFDPAKATAGTTVKLVQNTITLTTWSLASREEILEADLSTEQVLTLKPKELTAPKDFLPILNEKKDTFGYLFTYNSDEERFVVTTSKSHALKMSDSLASILGFLRNSNHLILNETKVADSFPLLHRAITDIYIYSNIVQEVYLGNVKAPLLLSCPFRRDGNYNNVTYIEFINPSFTALNRNSLQLINIDIRDGTGKGVPFLYGRTVLNLLFRRRQQTA